MDARPVAALATVLFLLPACGGDKRANPGPFAGHWSGHTRRLEITSDGRGREIVDDGCCHRVVTARFQILRVNYTPARAVASIKLTSARVDKAAFAENHIRVPRVGELGTLRLRGGVLTDDLTTVTFCAMDVDKCGL